MNCISNICRSQAENILIQDRHCRCFGMLLFIASPIFFIAVAS